MFFFLFVLCTQLTPSLSHFHFVSLLPSFVILFSVSSTLSLPSCCQRGHCAGEGTLRSLPATNLTRWEEVWQRTCALTRLIPWCFTVQSSRQREQPKVKHSRWMWCSHWARKHQYCRSIDLLFMPICWLEFCFLLRKCEEQPSEL